MNYCTASVILIQNEVFPLNKGLSVEELANWIFLVDTLNFNFWTPDGEPKFCVQHNGKVSAVNECYSSFAKLNIKHEEALLSFFTPLIRL